MNINLIIGRFNPFTIGHKNLLQNNEYQNVIFVINGAKSRTDFVKNPLSFEERYDLIKLVDENVIVIEALSINHVIDICANRNFIIKNVVSGKDRAKSYSRIFSEANIIEYDRSDKISSSLAKNYIINNDFISFEKIVPWNSKFIFDNIKEKITGWVNVIIARFRRWFIKPSPRIN